MLVARTYNVLNDGCDLLGFGLMGLRVLGTNVGRKLFVTLGFVVLLHFIQ